MHEFVKALLIFLFSSSILGCAQKSLIEQRKDVELVAEALNARPLNKMIEFEAELGNTLFILDNALKFVISENQKKINNGIRSEITVDYPFKKGEEVYYSFDIFIPISFKSDSHGRWSSLGQWHDQPNPDLSESWQTFPRRSPLVFIFDKIIDEKQVFGLNYGNEKIRLPLKVGQWNKLSFHFKWSLGFDGFLELKVNNGKKISFFGKNMHNAYQHYLKIGLYRHPNIIGANYVYYRNLKIISKK